MDQGKGCWYTARIALGGLKRPEEGAIGGSRRGRRTCPPQGLAHALTAAGGDGGRYRQASALPKAPSRERGGCSRARLPVP